MGGQRICVQSMLKLDLRSCSMTRKERKLFDQEVIQFEKGEYKMRGQEVKLAGQGEVE